EVGVFGPGLSLRIMNRRLAAGIGLVDVVEAAQVHALGAQHADVESGVVRWLEREPQAHLNAIGWRVILVETDDGRVAEKAAAGTCASGAESERSCIGIGSAKNVGECDRRNVRGAGESEKTRGCVQRIAIGSGIRTGGSSARGDLAGQQRHGNHAVENAGAAAHNNVVLGAEAVGESRARVKLLHGIVQSFGRKSFELIAKSVIQRQAAGGPPFVLDVETGVGVADRPLGLATDRRGNALAPEDGGTESRLGEVGRAETFKEEHLGRAGLQAEWTLGGEEAGEVCLKRIEERKRLGGVDVIEVAAETDGVFAPLPGHTIVKLFAAFRVRVRIAAVHSHRERVEHFQVRLGGVGGKVKSAMRELPAELVGQVGGDDRSQASHQALVAKVVVFEAGRQVEAVIERRNVGQPPVVEEVAEEGILALGKRVVQLEQEVIVVAVARDVQMFRSQS